MFLRLEALFVPGIGSIAIPKCFPEPRLVLCQKLDTAKPLHALPGVAVRDDNPQRRPVLRRQRLPVVMCSEHHLLRQKDIDWDIGSISSDAMQEDETRRRLHTH